MRQILTFTVLVALCLTGYAFGDYTTATVVGDNATSSASVGATRHKMFVIGDTIVFGLGCGGADSGLGRSVDWGTTWVTYDSGATDQSAGTNYHLSGWYANGKIYWTNRHTNSFAFRVWSSPYTDVTIGTLLNPAANVGSNNVYQTHVVGFDVGVEAVCAVDAQDLAGGGINLLAWWSTDDFATDTLRDTVCILATDPDLNWRHGVTVEQGDSVPVASVLYSDAIDLFHFNHVDSTWDSTRVITGCGCYPARWYAHVRVNGNDHIVLWNNTTDSLEHYIYNHATSSTTQINIMAMAETRPVPQLSVYGTGTNARVGLIYYDGTYAQFRSWSPVDSSWSTETQCSPVADFPRDPQLPPYVPETRDSLPFMYVDETANEIVVGKVNIPAVIPLRNPMKGWK